MSFQYPLILDGGFATELERSFGKDLSGKKKENVDRRA
jgi:homocysteine S-methyltransferase